MEIEVEFNKDLEEYLNEISENEVLVVGKGRETAKAVDLAEELKLKGYKVDSVEISTEEKEEDGKTLRISVIKIKMVK